jgi:hypothetical protein
LFGLTFFIAFRSKETGIILGLLIPGFFIDTGEELTLRRFLIKLGIILSGCFLGILVFMVLNGVFLKAPFFGLHPSDIRELIEFNTAVRVNQQDSTDNYLYYIASNSMFLLSLVWIIKSDDGFKRSDRWLWFSVLGIIPFLNLTNVNGGWRIVPHYLTPAIAILSILAPQVIQFDDSLSTRLKNSHGTIVIAASLLASGIVTSILATLIAGQAGWEFYYVVAGVLSPIALCILIFLLCFKKSNILNVIAIVACIGALTLPKATYNVFTTVATKPQPYSRFLPFIEFREAVTCTTDNVLISGTIYRKEGLLSRDAVSSWWMFNLFFRCHMTGRQFSYSLSHEDLSKDLASKSYRYIFLHDSDYQYLIDQKDRSHNIMDRYIIKADKSQQYYLLTINQ